MLQYSHLLSNRNIKSLKRGKTFYWKTTIVNYLLHAAFSVWFKSDFLSMFVFCRLLYVLPLTGPHGIFKASEIYYIVKLDYTIFWFCSRCKCDVDFRPCQESIIEQGKIHEVLKFWKEENQSKLEGSQQRILKIWLFSACLPLYIILWQMC